MIAMADKCPMAAARRCFMTAFLTTGTCLRTVQLLLGHIKLESTVRYLGIEVNEVLEMAEQTEAKPDPELASGPVSERECPPKSGRSPAARASAIAIRA